MKCALIRCPQTFGKYVTDASAVPPIGLAYVAASLVHAGHEVEVIDTTGEAIDEFRPFGEAALRRGLTDEQILARLHAPDLIGFSLMFSQDWLVARELIAKVRAAFPMATLVAGGEHFTADPMGALTDAPGLDFVVIGEGDRVICELIEHIEGRRDIADVPGVYYRASDGIRLSGGMLRVKDIDELPWPAWDLIPIENYLSDGHGFGVARGRSMPLIATRGCPYQCTFCSSPTMWTTRWTARSAEDVVKEIKAYIAAYRATNFDFLDLTAIVKKSWILHFARLLTAEELKITWQLPVGTRSEALDEEVLPLLYASGCTNLTYAPESGTEAILQKIKKKISRERMLRSMRTAVKVGCNVKANFVFGFPSDTYRDYLPTFVFLAKMAAIGVHDISVAPFRPYPGSALFRELQDRGVVPKPLSDDFYRTLFASGQDFGHAYESPDNASYDARAAEVEPQSFAEHMSPAGLDRLRYAAMLWFYLISWTLRPLRIFKLVYAVITNRQESRLDKSLVRLKQRLLGVKGARPRAAFTLGKVNP